MRAQEIRDNFARHGISVCDWARAHGFSESLVYAVISGRNKASRGQSFKIAVALGLKPAPPTDGSPSSNRTENISLQQVRKESS